MTPKEKAQELVSKYHIELNKHDMYANRYDIAKQCALIAVDEILLSQFQFDMMSIYGTPFNHYWEEVKKEIEKL
jgi:hypothetical protein